MSAEIRIIVHVVGSRGGRKMGFQQSGSTQSGAGEKETLNINVVGKTVLVGNEYSKISLCSENRLSENKPWEGKAILEKQHSYDYNNRVPGPAGGSKKGGPAITVDTLRGGRKGDPTHKCCGN